MRSWLTHSVLVYVRMYAAAVTERGVADRQAGRQ